MNKFIILISMVFYLGFLGHSYAKNPNQVIPFTLQDRDTLIRLEVKIEEGFKRVDEIAKAINQRVDETNKRIDETNTRLDKRIDETNTRLDKRLDETNKRIDETNTRMDRRFDETNKRFDNLESDLKSFMFWGFGVLFGLNSFAITLMFWDRRSMLKPIEKKQKSLEQDIIRYENEIKTIFTKLAELKPETAEYAKQLQFASL